MSSSYLVYLNIKHLTMKKLIDYFYTILLISSFFILDRLPPFFEIKFKERSNNV